jgi:phosphate transport system substrate-binding protein
MVSGVIFGRRFLLLIVALSLVILSGCRPEAAGDVQGTAIENVGSDTIVNLALAWAEAYAQLDPEVRVSVTGGGSGTGIASLINGTIDIANASRQIKPEEVAAAEANGVSPVEHVIARDAIAVVIHPENPVDRLTIAQVSAIYQGLITNWSEVGGEDRPIVLLSRETNSGTHVYFLEEVVRQGDSDSRALFSRDTLLLPSSEGISAEVRQNPNAIGYDGLGYVTPDQKVVAIASRPGGDYVLPTVATVNDASYPIARDLYMYTAGEPSGLVATYLEFVMGPLAQDIVLELGFVPLEQ